MHAIGHALVRNSQVPLQISSATVLGHICGCHNSVFDVFALVMTYHTLQMNMGFTAITTLYVHNY